MGYEKANLHIAVFLKYFWNTFGILFRRLKVIETLKKIVVNRRLRQLACFFLISSAAG